MSSSTHPTAAEMDVIDLTDSEDEDLPPFEELLQQSSQKSNSSQKTVKRLESMKLEDDGFEMTGSPSSTGLSFHPHSIP